MVVNTVRAPFVGLTRKMRRPVRSVTHSVCSGPQASSHGPSRPEVRTRIENFSGGLVTIESSCAAGQAHRTAITTPATRAVCFMERPLEHEGASEDPDHQERHSDLHGGTD